MNCKSHKIKQLALWIQSIPLIIIELMCLDGECLGLGENYCRLQCFWIFNWFARKFVINWIDLDRDGSGTRNPGFLVQHAPIIEYQINLTQVKQHFVCIFPLNIWPFLIIYKREPEKKFQNPKPTWTRHLSTRHITKTRNS